MIFLYLFFFFWVGSDLQSSGRSGSDQDGQAGWGRVCAGLMGGPHGAGAGRV